jgi:hypothetical protein
MDHKARELMWAIHPTYDLYTDTYPQFQEEVAVCSLGCHGITLPDDHDGFVIITMSNGKKFLVEIKPLD